MDIATTLKKIPVDCLSRGRYQPRREFNETALQELAESIRAQGIIEPIVVRPLSIDNTYEIIAGERRWRAAQLAGLDAVPCVVRHYSDEQAAEVTLIENIQREDLNPIEHAQALSCLIDDFFYTHEEVAAAVGKSRTKITNMLRLLHLDDSVQQLLIKKALTEGHGKMLAGLSTMLQIDLAKQAVNGDWSVRQLEQAIKQQKSGAHAPTTSQTDANIRHLEKMTSDHFGAEVVVENNQQNRSGWIKLRYQNYDVLAGILEKMGVECE